MSLHYQQIGQGPELVLLHGWGMNSQIWDPMVAQLQQHYHLTLIDLPGMGGSAFMDYDASQLIPELLRIAPAQATWLGWSLGGLLALQAAAKAPTQITSLVLVASSPCFVANGAWPGLSETTLNEFAMQLQADHSALVNRFLATHLMHVADRKMVRSVRGKVLAAGVPSVAALTAGLQLLSELDLRQVLQQLQCPSLHIYGRLDSIVPASQAEHVVALNPRAEIQVMNKAGHLPFLSDIPMFIKSINEFIDVEYS